uniref:Uncharacterized protein n=1 Tax=Oryza meridionalis TaxID=40149 RepID=A0A0E0CJH2_9ORYZ
MAPRTVKLRSEKMGGLPPSVLGGMRRLGNKEKGVIFTVHAKEFLSNFVTLNIPKTE